MTLGGRTANRVERFLDAHPDGRLMVCVGSASVAGIVWLAERTRRRPVTLMIGDLKSRNFAKAIDADRRAAIRRSRRGAAGVTAYRQACHKQAGHKEKGPRAVRGPVAAVFRLHSALAY